MLTLSSVLNGGVRGVHTATARFARGPALTSTEVLGVGHRGDVTGIGAIGKTHPMGGVRRLTSCYSDGRYIEVQPSPSQNRS